MPVINTSKAVLYCYRSSLFVLFLMVQNAVIAGFAVKFDLYYTGIVSLCAAVPAFCVFPFLIFALFYFSSDKTLSIADKNKLHKSVLVLVCSGVSIAFSVFLAVKVPEQPRERAMKVSCAARLKLIGLALAEYADDNQGFYPEVSGFPAFQRLFDRGYSFDRTAYICPCAEVEGDRFDEESVSYIYLGGGKVSDVDRPVILEKAGLHRSFGNVLYADGKVRGFSGKEWDELYQRESGAVQK